MARANAKKLSPKETLSEAIFLRYATQLRKYLIRRLRRPDDIPDITQEIFQRFLAKADRPEVIRKPLAYLYGIAAHAVADACIEQQADWVAFDSDLVQEAENVFDSAHPDEVSEQLAMERDIVNALASLPPNHLAAIILVKRDGLSVAEAAQRMNLSEITVRGYVCEARFKLKRILEEYARERKSTE